MKFFALVKNELKTVLPWILLSFIVIVGVGMLVLFFESQQWDEYHMYQIEESGQSLSGWELHLRSPLSSMGPVLLTVALAFGVIIGVWHFWLPFFMKTWGFTLHRSASRLGILSSKLTAAILAFLLGVVMPWALIFFYVRYYNIFSIPPSGRVFIEGVVFAMLGMVAYLAVALSAVSTARIYTTKIFPLAFAAMGISFVFTHYSLLSIFAVIVITAGIIKIQLVNEFLTREF